VSDLNKIPFGLRESDQQYVDIADVPNGNQSGCICPSCKTPLQARQGKIRNWYFAHSSKGVSDLTQNECEFSFWVSVLSMAKKVLNSEGTLSTPSYTRFIGFDELLIVDKNEVKIVNPKIEKNNFDAYCDFGKYSIGIVFSTPDKKYNDIKNSNKLTGILEISLREAINNFYSKDRSTDYKTILREIIFNNTTNKKWLYHPKIERYKERYGDKLVDAPPFNIGSVVAGLTSIKTRNYNCKNCNISWKGNDECPDCHGHPSLK